MGLDPLRMVQGSSTLNPKPETAQVPKFGLCREEGNAVTLQRAEHIAHVFLVDCSGNICTQCCGFRVRAAYKDLEHGMDLLEFIRAA